MVDSVIDGTRGVLYPARMPQFHRLPPPDAAAELVGWFWIPEWDIEPGRTSRQHIVAFPALNLVVERSGVELVGAATTASYRDLTGRGWAVGAMLRPAAAAALTDDPATLLDTSTSFDAPDLYAAVSRAMEAGGDHRHADAVRAFTSWLVERVGEISPVAPVRRTRCRRSSWAMTVSCERRMSPRVCRCRCGLCSVSLTAMSDCRRPR